MKKDRFSSTAEQKILDFLCRNPHVSFYGAEIALHTLLSKGGTNQALRQMAKEGLLKTEQKGRMIFYSVDPKSATVRQYKILKNVSMLEPLVEQVKGLSQRAVLFGSCALGEDTEKSDIDIFVVSNDKEKVRALVLSQPRLKEKIQLVVKSPQEYMGFDKKEPVFYEEIKKGIVLWEKE
ncbi:MAG TPA: nucleotidyltransferase domain-containing protein [Candidatus Omnitrophota bacterium]|nr:nucleotidyltransferase domain-containing protein [Candidatus Omnitrophota bacterium]HPD85595.1 nucleotidyltransferase domain-containing protein [Candidatus Omnitrophota bacterium]HRZ04523.1 nucleotidyltransferase domain-containing protein [Candidatus Omnitrophota bacterium]